MDEQAEQRLRFDMMNIKENFTTSITTMQKSMEEAATKVADIADEKSNEMKRAEEALKAEIAENRKGGRAANTEILNVLKMKLMLAYDSPPPPGDRPACLTAM